MMIRPLKKSGRSRAALLAMLLSAAGHTFAADLGVEPVSATPLLEQSAFSAAAAHSLSNDSPGAGDDLQALKAERFRELRAKLDELSNLMPGNTSPRKTPTTTSNEPQTMPIHRPNGSANEPQALSHGQHSPSPLPSDGDDNADHAETERPTRGNISHGSISEDIDDVLSHPASEGNLHASSSEPVNGPIDRFALASSLFGAGDLEACLNVLRQTNLKELSREDQIWSEYMQASCHRRAGRYDQARQMYRGILSYPEADWVGELARWWLDNLEAKQKLLADTQRLNATLTAWETEIAALGKKK
ncbi:tetratricopeptide repeat protein [Planctomicrobium piriforme]|uniref:Tetratricopeptide repeat-containing protein n=1 Tax=Planctomicrobium piriforme TaxID=1576369 RepID=A0A1I3HND5_9PLAN|nr:hypothetical protein [Planctomicrobium piriforme]SFI37119.1 hypothetical protein SAMN05421753_108129 [Planctomicrobium piriforme]